MTASNARGSATHGYHHGALREALIDGAIELLAESSGPLSLNEAARRAGVSSAAPYRHFDSKDALLAAVAERGYLRLIDAATTPFPTTADASDRLLLLCVRYIHFAMANPELFGVMFDGSFTVPNDIGFRSFEPFVAAVGDAMQDGILPPGDLTTVAVAVWSALHGITVLYLNQSYSVLGMDDAPDDLVKRMLGLYFPQLRMSVHGDME